MAILRLGEFVTLIILTGFCIAPRSVQADQIYTMYNYPSVQNGFTVSGTITTNGDTGTNLPVTDIKGWDITISNASGPIESFNPSNSNLSDSTGFDATTTAITIDPNLPNPEFLFINSSTTSASIDWNSNPDDGMVFYEAADSSGTFIWGQFLTPGPATVATHTSPAVPEPSSLVLGAAGAVVIIAYGWSRRRREKRQLAAA